VIIWPCGSGRDWTQKSREMSLSKKERGETAKGMKGVVLGRERAKEDAFRGGRFTGKNSSSPSGGLYKKRGEGKTKKKLLGPGPVRPKQGGNTNGQLTKTQTSLMPRGDMKERYPTSTGEEAIKSPTCAGFQARRNPPREKKTSKTVR